MLLVPTDEGQRDDRGEDCPDQQALLGLLVQRVPARLESDGSCFQLVHVEEVSLGARTGPRGPHEPMVAWMGRIGKPGQGLR